MTGILIETIKRKLKERHDKKYNPQPGDSIVNPLNSPEFGYLNPSYTTVAMKRALYNAAIEKRTYAIDEKFNKISLGDTGAEFNDVELFGGVWRIQNKFDHKITVVRKKEFVIGDKIPHTEHTNFEFYRAFPVCNNCYGRFIFANPDYIVARFETARGTYWAYGQTIDQARAYLGIKLCDEYQDIIHAEINHEKSK